MELHNVPMEINVKIKNNPEYGPQNIIRGYKAINTNGGRQSTHVPVKSPAPAPAANAAHSSPSPAMAGNESKLPPWKQR